MPPINTQSSRAGLVAALVVFTILFVTATIFAIYFSVQLRTTEQNRDSLQKKYNDIVAEAALNTPEVSALQTLRTDANNGFGTADTALDFAMKERDQLSQYLTGSSDAVAAVKAVTSSMTAATKAAKDSSIALPSDHDNVLGAVDKLTDGIRAQQTKIKDLQAQVKKAEDNLAAANKALATQGQARDKALADARASDAADLARTTDQFNANKAMVDQLQKDQADAAKKAQDAAQAAQTQLAQLSTQLQQAQEAVKTAQEKLEFHRPDVSSAAIRHPDGRIIRLPGGGICYINLGQGDQVSPGLTFEVYDKTQGVPTIPPGAVGDDQLPIGKASIEVTSVGATSSECRVVRTSPGAVLSEGDPIANLVYDPNTKYNFFVFGDFDLTNSGRTNTADEKVIERLVTQWGGKLATQVNVDTDFVVLGKEPVLPDFTKEQLENPLNADKYTKSQAALSRYEEILSQARDLHIPVLNQNRFLYYVGYYDQASR